MTPEQIFACTLWSEDRSGSIDGMEPIAGVILNRVENPSWWGKDVIGVCLCPGQFDGWFWKDPNFRPMLTVDQTDDKYADALGLAVAALRGDPINRANGADHYFAKTMAGHPPDWAFYNTNLRTGMRPTVYETTHHVFFKVGR